MTTGRFRTIAIAWVVLYGWWWSLPMSAYKQPPFVREALEHAGRGAVLPINDTLAGFLLLMTILSAIGLILFRGWARFLLLATTLFSVVCAPFGGVMVAGPMDGTLGFVVTLLTGTLLAVAFWSPIAAEFLRTTHPEDIARDEGGSYICRMNS